MKTFSCQTRNKRFRAQIHDALIPVRYAVGMEERKSVLQLAIYDAKILDCVTNKYKLERYRFWGDACVISKLKDKNDEKRSASARQS